MRKGAGGPFRGWEGGGGPVVRSSMTRIWPERMPPIRLESVPREVWSFGDYVLAEVVDDAGGRPVEIPGGRLVELGRGDRLIGVLGTRQATLELTGSWEEVEDNGLLHLLGTGGILGRLRSRSTLVPEPPLLRYVGHLHAGDERVTMESTLPPIPAVGAFATPVVLLTGTSMSAGKTTAGKVVVRRLRAAGARVLGAKLTGAGRHRDALGLQDAGAHAILDFVDAGLPSTSCPEAHYRPALKRLLAGMAAAGADVAVIEIGASPLEPYNGTVAIEAIRPLVQLNILCASDPYAVAGARSAYDLPVDLVTGPASNTEAGVRLVDRLTGLRALDLRRPELHPELDVLLRSRVPFGEAGEGREPGGNPVGSEDGQGQGSLAP